MDNLASFFVGKPLNIYAAWEWLVLVRTSLATRQERTEPIEGIVEGSRHCVEASPS